MRLFQLPLLMPAGVCWCLLVRGPLTRIPLVSVWGNLAESINPGYIPLAFQSSSTMWHR